MDVTKHDGIMLLYNFAVVFTGAYLVWTVEFPDKWSLMAVSFAIGIVWTVYFKFAMLHRFTDHPRFLGDDEEEESTGAEHPMQ